MHKTCPACGKTESAALPFVKAFCVECYSEREQLFEVPKKLELKRCTRCNKHFVSGVWKSFSEEEFGEWAASKIKSRLPISVKQVTLRAVKGGVLVTADIELEADATDIKKQVPITIGLQKTLCTNCHMKSGGYREAVIQLRSGTPERLRKVAETLIKQCEKESFVSDYEENKYGIDFAVGSRKVALQVIGALGRHFTHSNTLIGQRQGKRMFRATICVRMD
jgi:nonsense-mediated mRNA decay protein 3